MSLILIVDDESEAILSLSRALKLKDQNLCFETATNTEKALMLAGKKDFDLAIIDLNLEPKTGIESGFSLLEKLLLLNSALKIIVLTGNSCTENGVRALKMGAAHFLEKPTNFDHLFELIRDCIRQRQLFRAFKNASESKEDLLLERCLAGNSPGIKQLRQELKFAATTNLPVLLLGETGTGKTLCASLLHSLSPRANGKFITYTSSYVNADLVNSELFGHLKGSFTGAHENRRGLLREADGGSFFIDEIDELPHDLQVSLLNVLQNKTFRMLGSNTEEGSDFRFISASNRQEAELVAGDRLRPDFFHRIAQQIIHLPALRNRPEDLALIADLILENLSAKESLRVYSLSQEAKEKLLSYSWPGNVRELEAVVISAAYKARFEEANIIDSQHIHFRKLSVAEPNLNKNFHDLVEDYKLQLVEKALLQTDNNQVQAAKLLGLDRSCLRRIIGRQRYG